jgi:hypothetical protein
MNKKRIIILSTAGALALGLTVGGVATAFATEQSDAKAHHQVAPAVTPTNPVVPSNAGTHSGSHGGGSHPAGVPFTIQDIWNVIGSQYDSSLYPNARFEPMPGTYIGDLAQAGGLTEQYVGHDGNTVTIGVAKGAFPAMQQKIAQDSTLLTGFGEGVKVYEVHGGGTYTGDYEVFVNGYWFSFTSNLFTSPQAATPMIQAALQTIPQG